MDVHSRDPGPGLDGDRARTALPRVSRESPAAVLHVPLLSRKVSQQTRGEERTGESDRAMVACLSVCDFVR